VLAAQDEPAIIMHMTYVEALDELLGFCGVTGDNHQYLDHFTVEVGDGKEGYITTILAFQECKRLLHQGNNKSTPPKPLKCSYLVYTHLQ